MKIYTRRGDQGETTLLGGVRVPKSDPRVEAYGSVDELNAALGGVLALGGRESFPAGALEGVQADLFVIGARLAAAQPREAERRDTIPGLDRGRLPELERRIDGLEAELPALDSFILPGGTPLAAQLHVARTVCRRAERSIVALLAEQPELAEVVIPYMNRLSDLLFSLARTANRRGRVADVPWRRPPRKSPRTGSRAGEEGGAA